MISRSPFLSALAPVAGAHHERLDGSGYHRGSSAAELALPARLLAAADAFHAMCEPRPHREPLAPERAAETLGGEARAGRLDSDAVTAVVEAAGERVLRLERPAGLTEREAEVVGMLAAASRPSRSPGSWESRSRPPTAISSTPTARSASRPARRRRCSRWSMAWSHQENSRLCAWRLGPSVRLDSTSASSANEERRRRGWRSRCC